MILLFMSQLLRILSKPSRDLNRNVILEVGRCLGKIGPTDFHALSLPTSGNLSKYSIAIFDYLIYVSLTFCICSV